MAEVLIKVTKVRQILDFVRPSKALAGSRKPHAEIRRMWPLGYPNTQNFASEKDKYITRITEVSSNSVNDWLMPCRCLWRTNHRLHVSIKLCSYAVASVFFHLYSNLAVHNSVSRSLLFCMFVGRRLPLRPSTFTVGLDWQWSSSLLFSEYIQYYKYICISIYIYTHMYDNTYTTNTTQHFI